MQNDTPTPLTDQALQRLRKLGEGNHVPPEKIHLIGAEEKIYTIKGTLTLTPKCEVRTGRYAGAARGGKNRQVFPDLPTMHDAVNKKRQEFESGRSWFDAAMKELKAVPGQGWGVEGARITLPEQTIVMTASTGCPSCQGRRLVTCRQCGGSGSFVCSQCGGSRQELCHACGGSGRNPQDMNQNCSVCGGSRFTTCRRCGGSGQMTCPTCHGRRGTPCPACNGSGLVSEEIGLDFGIETHFQMETEGLPSGLRNGIGRLGNENLGKGHADITLLAEEEEKDKAKPQQQDPYSFIKKEEDERKIVKHDLRYETKLPYADLRMDLNGTKVVVGVFGKRAALLNVPPFIDRALEPVREKLKQAAQTGMLDEVLETRAIAEALQLELGGKGNAKEFRRFYPVGMSQPTMLEILGNLHRALKKYTFVTRSIAAVLCGILSTGIFAAVFFTGLHARLVQGWQPAIEALFDFTVLAVPMIASWFALKAATRLRLQKKFHGHSITLQQKTGKTGYILMAAIFVLFAVIVFLAPIKPFWLTFVLHRA